MKKLIIIMMLFVVPSILYAGPKKIPASNFEVVSIKGRWIQHGWLEVVGEIKNIGSVPGAPMVEINARDKNGTLVDTAQIMPAGMTNLQPGQTVGVKHPLTYDKTAVSVSMKIISAATW